MSAPSLDAYWMPFTANRAFKAAPRLLVAAEGLYYRDAAGRQILDGASGLYCTPAGHGRREIAAAISEAATRLDYAPPFQFGHPAAFELAETLAALTPDGLDRIFFVNSGSEAVDTALKIALAYHVARGQGRRTRLIGRERGYHGVNFGGVAVGGMMRNRVSFGLGLPGVDHLRHTWAGPGGYQRGDSPVGADLAEDLQRAVDLHGAETIAAVIVEPVAGSTGILPPPQGYLRRLREIASAHGILLIFDEVITGFGRTGAAFAADEFAVTPDLMCLAKALTNGAVPMGAVAVDRSIHDAIIDAAPAGIELYHGYTWSAHPVACAAALASLRLYRDEGLFAQARALVPGFLDAVFSLRDLPGVTDIRGYGLLAGIDLAPVGTPGGASVSAPGARGAQVMQTLFEAGLMARVSGDTLVLAPPFIATPDDVARMVEMIRAALTR